MSSDSESNNLANLSRISAEDIMEEDVEESPTHKLTSHVDVRWCFDRAIRIPFLKVKQLKFAHS